MNLEQSVSTYITIHTAATLPIFIQGCATSPNDSQRQVMLRSAAEELRSATNTAASNALKKKLIQRLEVCTKIGVNI